MAIYHLPTELLCQIFSMAVYEEDMDTAKIDSPVTARALSQTCSFWRQLCLAYPDMWTFIPMDNMSEELCWLFAARSASSLLTLYFERRDGTCTNTLYTPRS